MDLARRTARADNFSAQSDLGSAARLAANRSGAQCAAIQERDDLSAAILVRAGSFMQPLAFPVWLAGLVWYLAAAEGKRFRFLSWAYLIVLAIFIVLGGKSYYALPVYPVLMAAGGVALEAFFAAPVRRWMAVAFPALLVVAGLVTLPF